MFSLFNDKKYFPTEIGPKPIEEGVIRTKNKTNKRVECGKSWVRKSKKRVKVITQSLKTNTDQDKKMPNTKNRFSILEYFSEEGIEKLINGETFEDKPKRKNAHSVASKQIVMNININAMHLVQFASIVVNLTIYPNPRYV